MPDLDLPSIITDVVPGPNAQRWSSRLRQVESPDTTFLSDGFPTFWSSAQGSLVTDCDGNRFLDLSSSFGVLNVGHCHPKVVAAIQHQSAELIHGMGDVHPSTVKVELLEKISEHSPLPNPLITLGLNGSDAVEAALKTSILATDKPGVIAFTGAYHGLTYGALGPTERAYFRDPFTRQRGHFVQHLPFGSDAALVEEAIRESSLGIGAVIVEPIQGRAGVIIPAVGWLSSLKSICDRTGALLIFDEIFTGWGRTGDWFAADHEKVVPDLLCIGKGMGGGMPLSACLGARKLMERAWAKSSGEARHTYTFLGHPLSCASALATIQVLESEGLVARARITGDRLLTDLRALAARYPSIITDVRGRGMMLGVEFVASELVWRAVEMALRSGLILLPAGDRGQVLEIIPPLNLTDRQASWSVDALDHILARLI